MTLKELLAADVDDVFLNTDEFAEAEITIATVEGGTIPWTAVVGSLTNRLVEVANGKRLEWREVVQITGKTDDLTTIPLPEQTQVTVTRYGDVAFHIYPDETKYGRELTTLTLVRQSIARSGNVHAPRSS